MNLLLFNFLLIKNSQALTLMLEILKIKWKKSTLQKNSKRIKFSSLIQ